MPDPTAHRLRIALLTLAAIIVALLIFHAGIAVGSRRAFRDRGGDFAGRPPMGLPHVFIANGHGAIGSVESISPTSFTLKTRAGETETVMLATTTAVRAASGSATTTLAAGETVLVLGTPSSQGAIKADVIRILNH